MKSFYKTFSKLLSVLTALTILFLYTSCNDNTEKNIKNANEIESNKSGYIQDIGTIMLNIQARHTKLYYAGKNENWKLASFLTHELKESFKAITIYHRTHDNINLNKLTNQIVLPVIEELEKITEKERLVDFNTSFDKLTISCNECHIQSNHSFIKIVTPINGDFLNQDFTK